MNCHMYADQKYPVTEMYLLTIVGSVLALQPVLACAAMTSNRPRDLLRRLTKYCAVPVQ